MNNAYGYNRDPKDFAHVPFDEGRLFIDHNGTREELDDLINKSGLREGDTLYVLAVSDFGAGMAAAKTKEIIEAKGIIVEVLPIPETEKPSGKRGRPAWEPAPELDDTLRDMWRNPIRYTQKYVTKYASEKSGTEVTRNQLNHRYGKRYPKEGQE